MATYQELQKKNVRKSWMLVLIVASIMMVMGALVGAYMGGTGSPVPMLIGAGAAAVIALFQALIAFSAGADIVLSAHGAREINADSQDFRQLYNVCEEMKIASGIPMPRVYVIHDQSPNAFATGRSLEDGRVCVTTGLMECLNREELQGVVAHEMAHIKNRDILHMTMVGVMVGTIVLLSDIALRSVFWTGGRGGGDRDDNKAQAIILVAVILFSILAPIFAQFVRMAISREREYLADATGAQFTRYPQGLASALHKIANAGVPLRKHNRATEHMFISPPKADFSAALSTHPPIEKRIERLQEIGRGYQTRQSNESA